jgi:radical SAM superfamily enzyme YgiQ (UPF0313 family)
MKGTLDIAGKHKTLMPNAALLTLIALTPDDANIEYTFCDENIKQIDWNIDCDLVAITGYTLQFERMKIISAGFRKRGIPVAVGGIYATIDSDTVKEIADHLFIGEAEYTWPQFLLEWTSGTARPVYRQGTFIEMKDSPAPDLSYIIRKGLPVFFSTDKQGLSQQL